MRRGFWWTLLSTAVCAGIVALGALGGALYWDRVDARGQQATREAIIPIAGNAIPRLFGYDYQTVEASLAEAADSLTPEYRREFQDQMNKTIIPEARNRQIVAQATVVGVGVLEAQRTSGSTMVFVNQSLASKSQEPLYQGFRLKVDLLKVDGKWLISYVTPI